MRAAKRRFSSLVGGGGLVLLGFFLVTTGLGSLDVNAKPDVKIDPEQKQKRPPCPISLHSKNPNFKELVKTCDFNRKLLPACQVGTQSVNLNGTRPNVWLHRQQCSKEWTLILYMALDNDLNKFGLQDFSELFWEKANDDDYSYDIVADIDFFKNSDATNITSQKSRGMRALIERTREGRITLANFDRDKYFGMDPNTGDPEHFEEFLMWAVEKFPARNYMVIIGGHGDGWAAMASHNREIKDRLWGHPPSRESALKTARVQRKRPDGAANIGRMGHGIAVDFSHQDWLDVRNIRLTLNRVTRKLLGGEPIEIFATDACYMQQAEVAYDLRKVAKFIYGSIPIMESQGLPYDKVLKRIDTGEFDGAEGPEKLAVALPHIMVDHYATTGDGNEAGKNDGVMASTIRASALQDGLLKGLLGLGIAGTRWIHGYTDPERAQFAVIDAIDDSVKYQNSVIDLKDFLQKLREYVEAAVLPGGQDPLTIAVLEQIEILEEEIGSYIISFAAGSHFTRWEGRMAGLSIWLPSTTTAFRGFLPSVANSYLHRQTFDASRDHRLPNEWTEFIANLFSEDLKPLEDNRN